MRHLSFPRALGLAVWLILSLPAILPAQTPGATPPAVLPVTHVTLYTSGVGYFERGGAIEGDVTQTLLFPVGQVNDVLKSLVLLDSGGGSIRPVTYAAQDPVGRQLQAFSIDLSDNPDQATLLARLRGARVTVTLSTAAGEQTLSGVIVGVETRTITLPGNGGTVPQSRLNLLTDRGLRLLPLDSISALEIADPALAAELRQALTIVGQGRDAGKRPITLNFSGRGRRRVLIGYLTETPLWQTTYRLVLGAKPLLQGWALVQNTGQDDWNGVGLTLVSGRPISFIQDLYTPLYVPRPTVEAQVQASPTPQTYNGNLGQAASDIPDVSTTRSPAPALPPTAPAGEPQPQSYGARRTEQLTKSPPNNLYQFPGLNFGLIRQSVAASGSKLGTALFSYQIKVPVTVPRQQSAMISFVADEIQAQPVAIYDAEVETNHPLEGARLKNTTGLHLMGGPLTVFAQGGGRDGYVGDALIDDTEPGQTRLISYAVDQAVDADVHPGTGGGQIIALKIAQGDLTVTRKYRQTTVYTFKNNGSRAETVVVEHPYRGETWKLIEPKAATGRTASQYRFDLSLPAGTSRRLEVKEEYPQSQTFGLVGVDPEALLAYIHEGEASPALRAAMQELIARRRQVAAVQTRIAKLGSQIAAITAGQGRIRENMKTLDHTSTLYRRYESELNDQETRLQALAAEKDTQQEELDRQQADLNDYIAKLTLD